MYYISYYYKPSFLLKIYLSIYLFIEKEVGCLKDKELNTRVHTIEVGKNVCVFGYVLEMWKTFAMDAKCLRPGPNIFAQKIKVHYHRPFKIRHGGIWSLVLAAGRQRARAEPPRNENSNEKIQIQNKSRW